MKTLLIRVLVPAVLLTGGLTAVSVTRLVLADAPPRPQGPPLPFIPQEEGAPERLAAALGIPIPPGPAHSRDAPDRAGAARSAGDGWAELHRHLEGAFPRVHERLEVERVGEGSLLYRWTGSDGERAPVLLLAHLDVADPAPEAGPGPDPRPGGGLDARSGADPRASPGAVFEEGVIRGAGILDGRGPAMAILEAVEGLLAQGFTPGATVLLALGHDRHRGGFEGAGAIARRLDEAGVRPAWVLGVGPGVTTGAVPGVRAPVGLVGTTEVRELTLALDGGEGDAGDADLAARVVAALDATPFPARLEAPYRELITMLAGRMDPGSGLLATNLWLFRRPLLWALGADPVWSTQVRSSVEPLSRAEGDRHLVLRVAPWDAPERLLGELRQRAAGVGVELAPTGTDAGAPPPLSATAGGGPGLEAIREAAHRIFPDLVGVGPFLVTAPTDARHFEGVAGAVYRFTPVRAERADLIDPAGRDESLTVRQYLQMVRFYAELLGRGAGA